MTTSIKAAYVTLSDQEGGTIILLSLMPATGLFTHWHRAGLRSATGGVKLRTI